MLEILPIMLALFMLVVFYAYYAQNYAGIIGTSLHKTELKIVCHRFTGHFSIAIYVYMVKQSQSN